DPGGRGRGGRLGFNRSIMVAARRLCVPTGSSGLRVVRGEGRGLGDAVQHRGEVREDLLVPEAEHAVAITLQVLGARFVLLRLLVMDATVQLYHQLAR